MFSAGEALMHIYWKDLSSKLVRGYFREVHKKNTKTWSHDPLVACNPKASDVMFLSSRT